MRRSPFSSQCQNHQEPMIVVEESGNNEEEEPCDQKSVESTPRQSLDVDSPMNNPYLLSPWRDPRETRKHSLPTPQCTSGITASQVRRLSERGGEGSGPSVREAAFLATLSSAPAPTPGGRRHSVVTISKVPSTLFGRNRRESIAAFPTVGGGVPSRTILASRRESAAGALTGPPPSAEHRGSVHNLQLDIMDDIVTARKVRMKMWNTSSEKVCEVQPLDEDAGPSVSPQRYTQQQPAGGPSSASLRRYSDFVGTTLAPIPSAQKRRASEYPTVQTNSSPSSSGSSEKHVPGNAGIVCTNTDLISILSSLASSATEINQCGKETVKETVKGSKSFSGGTSAEQKRSRLKNNRSNSFDVSILHGLMVSDESLQQQADDADPGESRAAPTSWFVKRHQPMSKKDAVNKKTPTVTFLDEKKGDAAPPQNMEEAAKVVWDEQGAVIDAQVIGSAIEGFLRKVGGPDSPSGCTSSASSSGAAPALSKGAVPKSTLKTSKSSVAPGSGSKSPSGWFAGKVGAGNAGNGGGAPKGAAGTDETKESCDTSLCSTLKDLFVK